MRTVKTNTDVWNGFSRETPRPYSEFFWGIFFMLYLILVEFIGLFLTCGVFFGFMLEKFITLFSWDLDNNWLMFGLLSGILYSTGVHDIFLLKSQNKWSKWKLCRGMDINECGEISGKPNFALVLRNAKETLFILMFRSFILYFNPMALPPLSGLIIIFVGILTDNHHLVENFIPYFILTSFLFSVIIVLLLRSFAKKSKFIANAIYTEIKPRWYRNLINARNDEMN